MKGMVGFTDDRRLKYGSGLLYKTCYRLLYKHNLISFAEIPLYKHGLHKTSQFGAPEVCFLIS